MKQWNDKDILKIGYYLTIAAFIFFFFSIMGCASNQVKAQSVIETQRDTKPISLCWYEQKVAQELYAVHIKGIVPAAFIDETGKPQSYFVVTVAAMNEMDDRYDALVDYVYCNEWKWNE